MKRIDSPTSVDGKFVAGNPAIGRKATQLSPEWCNNVQEEICNAIKAITGNEPTGAAAMNELAAAIVSTIGAVITSVGDNRPAPLIGKLFSSDMTGAPGAVVFEEVNTQDNVKKLKGLLNGKCVTSGNYADESITEAALGPKVVSHAKIGSNAVYGDNMYYSVVNKSESTSVSSNTTKTKVCDFVAIYKNGFFDLTVVSNFAGSGNVPSGVTLAVEDADGHELASWQVNGGGSIAGSFSKRMVAKQSNDISTPKMLSLYIKNGTIGYGWTLGVEVDGIILY